MLGSILIIGLISSFVEAQTVKRVPGDFPTIQAAINAAQAGDTIRVSPGVYAENINFLGKAITVVSIGGADITTIDGGLAGPVVQFASGEGLTSVLDGFTLRNGKGVSFDGGGIRIFSSSPTIRHNRIVNNISCAGPGIALNFGSPLIQANVISDNASQGCTGGSGGGGIQLGGSGFAQILDNIISNNTSVARGGGISLFGGSPVIRGNVITGNRANDDGGGISMVNSAQPQVIQNVIAGNTSTRGGGIYWLLSQGNTVVTNNTIVDNDGGQQGSAIYADGFDGSTPVKNNLIIGKTGRVAILCGSFADPNPPILRFNNVYSDQAAAYAGICTDVTGTNGNISAAPSFIDRTGGNFRLLVGSAGIDAGDKTDPNLPATDLDSIPRVLPLGGAVDMGAYEFATATTSTVSPTSITFADQIAGTISAQSDVVLTNTGAAPLFVSRVAVSGEFSQTNTCQIATGTPAGQSCIISVRFAPTAGGARSGQLTIVSNAGSNSVSLSGNGIGDLTLSTSVVAFSDQRVSTTSGPTTVIVSNTGTGSLSIGNLAATGDFTQANNCPASLAAGETCTIDVTFTPTSRGPRFGAVTIASNVPGGPHYVTLSGLGIAPVFSATPSNLSFGGQPIGTTSSPLSVTITNQGNMALTISNIFITGDFTETHNCASTLGANQSCTINVVFAPTARFNRSGTLTVVDDASGSPHSIGLIGTGTAAVLQVSGSLSFGNQPINTTSTPSFITLRNLGDIPMTISSISTSGDFSTVLGPCVMISPGLTCNVFLTFTPTSVGPRTGTLTIVDSAIGSPHILPMSGVGVDVFLSPSSLNFGAVQIGTTVTNAIALTNNSPNVVNITNISAPTFGFSRQSTCGTSLAAGTSCMINVTFAPMNQSLFQGTIVVTDDATGSPHSAALSGTGVIGIVSLSSTSLAFGSNLIGAVVGPRTLTLTNVGTGTLTIASITTTGDFTQTNTCPATVTVGSSCSIGVMFSPTTLGDRTGSLTIVSDALGTPHNATLTGAGIGSLPLPVITSITPDSGLVGTPGITLTVNGSGFVSTSSVRWGGIDRPTTFVSNTALTATIPASEFGAMTTIPVSVLTPAPGGGLSNSASFFVYRALTITAKDLIYDRARHRIYASVAGNSPMLANTLTPMDPVTGGLGTPVVVGSDPGKLAISNDSRYIYVGLDGPAQVRRFDIVSQTLGTPFFLGNDVPFGPYRAEDIAISPGNPDTIAVSRKTGGSPKHAGVAIYDNGVPRPITTATHTGSNVIEFATSPSVLYGYNNETTEYGFRTMSVDASGVTTTNVQANLITGSFTDIQLENGRLYTTNGRVVDPVNRTILGTFSLPAGGDFKGVVADSGLERAFFLFVASNSVRILAFDLNTFTQTGSVTLPIQGSVFSFGSLVRWGADGLAFRSPTQVFTMRIPDSWLSFRKGTRDFGGDGRSDVLWRDAAGTVSLWQMNGPTIAADSQIANIWPAWAIVGAGDFNADGMSDILWRDPDGNVVVWLMNGAIISSYGFAGNLPLSRSISKVADFNGDGKADIVWRDLSGDVGIWLMNGTAIASSTHLGNIWTGWTIVGTGDFNADGRADILWRDVSGDVAIWLMNGASAPIGIVVGNIWTGWTVVGTGDFNADGKGDILWRDVSGNVAVWLMNGPSIVNGTVIGNVWTGWTIAGTGDYNGDGKTDILWRDVSGNVSIWFMDGSTLSSYASPGNVSDRTAQ